MKMDLILTLQISYEMFISLLSLMGLTFVLSPVPNKIFKHSSQNEKTAWLQCLLDGCISLFILLKGLLFPSPYSRRMIHSVLLSAQAFQIKDKNFYEKMMFFNVFLMHLNGLYGKYQMLSFLVYIALSEAVVHVFKVMNLFRPHPLQLKTLEKVLKIMVVIFIIGIGSEGIWTHQEDWSTLIFLSYLPFYIQWNDKVKKV